MRKLLLLILLTFPLQWSFAQTNLGVTDKLSSLGKLYGYLKYYHPNVAAGQFNWDQQLLNLYPKVVEAENKADLSQVYLSWIESLGTINPCNSCEEGGDYFEANFDLNWLNDSTVFSVELISKLNHIRQNRAQNGNHYVSAGPAGQVQITNEPIYPDIGFPKEAERLLGLFKYWNLIEYYYPYKYLNDTSWGAVLKTMIPEFKSASDLEAYHKAIKKLIAFVDDSHAWISLDANKKGQYLPVRVTNIEQKMVVFAYYDEGLAAQNNLKLGDVITHINGEEVTAAVEALWPYRGGSNDNHRRIRIYYDLLNAGTGPLNLTVQRGDQNLEISSERYAFDRFNYRDPELNPSSKSLDDEVGYINMISLGGKEISKIFKQFKDKKAIIIDVRNYPTQTLYRTTQFLNTQDRVFAKIFKPNFNYPGKFYFDKGPETQSSKRAFEGKVILLVNQESISWSEFTAMALQTAPNVITLGSQTAGADGNVLVFNYLGGYQTAISGLGIMYPDGRLSQREGIAIDVEIQPSIEGLRAGRDEVLEKAIELAKQ
ncbi:S41 family peptidase [Gilvibacter sediminis]|uniref:S41 family peptidase n=1 Tax=Gilvibacter sediminis TaxID=379071 RepID=UPI00235057EA|nr:S41 family peptidase [Gilvibacter sediminis]MDC7997004.1 S41 family peptidase [Gilvibacter sediminis]